MNAISSVVRAQVPLRSAPAPPARPLDSVQLGATPAPAPHGKLTTGKGSDIDPQMGAHRGGRAYPVEMWIFKGNLESDGPGPHQEFSIGENFWHVRPVVHGHKTIATLAHHAALTDYQSGEYLAQEQTGLILPWVSRLDEDHFDFKVTYGLGGDVHHPLSWLKRLHQLGQQAHAERTPTGISIDAPLADGGRAHLDLTPATPPVWWKIQMGLGGQADLMAFPIVDAHGTITRHGTSTAVHGPLYCEQIVGGQDLRSSYKNLTWFFFDVDADTRAIVYDFTDKDGNKVTPQVKFCHRDGRLEEYTKLSVTPLATWKSPSTGREYPTRWKVEIPDRKIAVEIKSRMDVQEVPGLEGLKPFYYGGVEASGTIDGQPFASQGYAMQQNNDSDLY